MSLVHNFSETSDNSREIGKNPETKITSDALKRYDKIMGDVNLPERVKPFEELGKKRELTEEEKQRIKEETGWSDEIIDAIRTMREYEVYKAAGLKEAEIGGKKCLIRDDIDWNQVDEKGRTNQERVERGLAPLDKNGNAIELHHIGQHADSPLAELTVEQHRGTGNDTILHDKSIQTETHGEGNNWDNERQTYWKNRAEYNLEGDHTNG